MAMLFSLCGNVYAVESSQSCTSAYSVIPSEYHLSLMNHCQETPVRAWFVDNEGNRTEVKPINMSNPNARSFIDGRVEWTFLRYEQNVTKENRYQHFVSSCSWRNRGTVPMTMHYTQESTTTTSWQVNGKVDVETDLAVAILNQLKVEFGTNIVKSTVTSQSDKIETDLIVPVGKTGEISKYYAGKYSGGQGVWTGVDIFNGTSRGTYYEEASAWGVAKNEVNWDFNVF